ncbi:MULTISPECIES: tol-pal system protein YbgF [Aliivibrio]|uniref:Cell division coordinator CpoB n=1 Tax=Aliivibrio finisterrensis TaxID=511998 RepID=A0A4Q5KT95_9GAMM|nr:MULTISPECIES: tol-pal system protein YbgF [Aliivibrio]MDD9179513.1 tol-pal system protein YbgF [Aliivibrio sp. A6]RYU50969.1 tol-pal system protein YbgF [Aliivibrio finisterrensis]RYU51670.1 tol-pal system protein YbgF [Aliivibrio finisterrensis]RYU57480.1 tol-pal system protein YbgF [Aliivibrio finisterrensis]RYU63991.1 tol-pal system protein YbgF [Aliivibrio finisterrensis]
MKYSNLKRIIPLTLLASAATLVVAAPAPVTDLNATSNSTSSAPASSASIERLERLIKSRNQIQLQLQQQLDGLSEELSEMRGMVERNSYELDQMLERQRQLYIEIDTLRTAKPVPVTTPAEAIDSSSGAYAADTNENEAYQNAVDLILKKKDYAGATKAFQDFVAAYPDSVYSSNAHYWLGQLYFAQKNDIEAAKSFAKVVSYADSNKRADALLKLGELAKRNNNKAAAQKYYQKVISEYPDSTTAKTADNQLKSL